MRAILIVILVLIPSLTFSAPDKYTNYVMNTPVSIHDLGIYKIEKFLNELLFDGSISLKGEWSNKPSHKSVSISFDYDKNIYNINSRYLYNYEVDKKSLKSIAYSIIDKTRLSLGCYNNADSIKCGDSTDGYSLFTFFMGNEGYVSTAKPKNLELEIDKKVVINVKINVMGKHSIICSSELLGLKILCSE